jgi:hypothetical protein
MFKVFNGKFHSTRQVENQETRWENVVRRDSSQIPGIRGCEEKTHKTENNGDIF